ncbi:hypothetical protein SAMN05421788_10670 [Filimonas lacunae]|uniref:Uncharacterized protein n=2 Tax=Filimonas lacunae TaxID=477680 RepID=A0A173MES0_9BACT|nr:hypothetical protein FLA_2011 [Filimonas lacunae]SIT24110.1 hypothetical protein SAMN05421788_10670 [Filimonas lacunae]
MKEEELDNLIAQLGKEALLEGDTFQAMAKLEASRIVVSDLKMLRSKLHHPPTVHPDISRQDLGLSGWLSICQHVILELVYHLGADGLDFLKSMAFGVYDWPQGTALVIICRLYIDGKLSDDVIDNIAVRLGEMRYETHLRLAHGLVIREKEDSRYGGVIDRFTDVNFQLALAETPERPRMTREQLIEVGNKIMSPGNNEEDTRTWMEIFDLHVPYPNGSSLFFIAEGATIDDWDYNPTVEEVVDKCLSYNH